MVRALGPGAPQARRGQLHWHRRDSLGPWQRGGRLHVAAHKAQSLNQLWSQRAQTPTQRGSRAPGTHPEQSPTMPVDLVDERQEAVRPFAMAPVNLVDANGADPFELAVRQAPVHAPLDRTINRFPTHPKAASGFTPGQAACPTGQKSHHRLGQRPLAFTPRQIFHHDPVRSTDHPARSIAEPHRNLPQRHEAPTALLHHVISRTRLEALRTAAMNSLVRLHPDFNPGRYPAAQTNALVNKSHKMLNPVEDGFNFQLHRWSPARWFAFVFNSQTTRIHSDQRLPFYNMARLC